MADDANSESDSVEKTQNSRDRHEIAVNGHTVDTHYLTFVSIVFGVFISVWLEPIVTSISNQISSAKSTPKEYISFDLKGVSPYPIILSLHKERTETIESQIINLKNGNRKTKNKQKNSIPFRVSQFKEKLKTMDINWESGVNKLPKKEIDLISTYFEGSANIIKNDAELNKLENNIDIKIFKADKIKIKIRDWYKKYDLLWSYFTGIKAKEHRDPSTGEAFRIFDTEYFVKNYKNYILTRGNKSFYISNTGSESHQINIKLDVIRNYPAVIYAPETLETKMRNILFQKNMKLSLINYQKYLEFQGLGETEYLSEYFPKASFVNVRDGDFAYPDVTYVPYILHFSEGRLSAWDKTIQFFKTIDWLPFSQGLLMFLILICLWWWYGMFLGRYAPATDFKGYAYDFISLGVFALAFRFWDHTLLYPLTVFMAQILILPRFSRVYQRSLDKEAPERHAMLLALFLVGFYMLVIIIFAIAAWVFNQELPAEWLGYAVMVFHFLAILATVYTAIKFAEKKSQDEPPKKREPAAAGAA